MKALHVIALALVVATVGLVSLPGCSANSDPKTTIAPTVKLDTVWVLWSQPGGDSSDCDLYVNGELYSTIFKGQIFDRSHSYDTLVIPNGSRIEAQWMDGWQLQSVDTVVTADTMHWQMW